MKNKNLIAISGKRGSGKNLVSEMMMFLMAQKHQSIKNTSYKDFCALKNVVTFKDWEYRYFSYKSKYIVAHLLGIKDVKVLDLSSVKNTILPDPWKLNLYHVVNEQDIKDIYATFKTMEKARMYCHYYSDLINRDFDIIEELNVKLTIRDLIILIAEEFKKIFGDTFWTEEFFKNYDSLRSKWIIQDMRFKHEFDAVSKLNGITIRIESKNVWDDFGNSHPRNKEIDKLNSETELDNMQLLFDYVIINNDSEKELFESVKYIVKTIQSK